jgi:hypothetical protein
VATSSSWYAGRTKWSEKPPLERLAATCGGSPVVPPTEVMLEEDGQLRRGMTGMDTHTRGIQRGLWGQIRCIRLVDLRPHHLELVSPKYLRTEKERTISRREHHRGTWRREEVREKKEGSMEAYQRCQVAYKRRTSHCDILT